MGPLTRMPLFALFVRCSVAFLGIAQQPLVAQSRIAQGDTAHASKLPVVTPELERYIHDVMESFHAPGMAIAIVQGNETWAKGFGYASLPSTPVTPHTLFSTGSTTKSFTAAGISLLIENTSDYSSIKWTTPVSSLLREDFVLSDGWATEHITIEDVLSHRTGYPRHDLVLVKTTKDIVRNLRNLPMSAEPRAKFQYNNQMFATAGYLIETLTGLSLSAFFHEYLWGPMGMNETFLDFNDPELKARSSQVADEYYYKNSTGEYIQIPHVEDVPDAGAGAVVSNVLDYAKYLRTMMGEEGPLSKDSHRELKTARSFWDRPGPPYVGPTTYSLGWASGIFQDEQVWFHAGWTGMFLTEMLMVPSKEIGIVVMINSLAQGAIKSVLYRILYDLFEVEEKKRFDFEAAAREQEALLRRYFDMCPRLLYPDIPSPPLPPTLPLANHTGEYRDPGYGSYSIGLECDEDFNTKHHTQIENAQCHLIARSPEDGPFSFYADLEHQTGDYWVGWLHQEQLQDPETKLGCMKVQFFVDEKGIVSRLGIDARQEGADGPLVWFDRVE
ncbi:penicillin-binding protein [Xylariales sp. AK1849]|nr:penicillin-binding protein [Xylariales sp. AK1849]